MWDGLSDFAFAVSRNMFFRRGVELLRRKRLKKMQVHPDRSTFRVRGVQSGRPGGLLVTLTLECYY